ncbi:vacuolar membrane [Pyrenophora seminiperda CCB06]|uniref:Vacuolar membrane n=1 Tax=Pyrenophora seminiperda CCB06 TaxID=1302712 RepID=A0A3M7M9Q0_9PLEO|nr:vacuolar membrane [Pyrenophora seminiperda CCB06]
MEREELVETTPLSPRVSVESDVSEYLRGEDFLDSPASDVSQWSEGGKGTASAWTAKLRHAVGIALLLATVLLWTASNFLASTIFADNSYSKPYLVTYVNTTFFVIPLIPMFLHHLWVDRHRPSARQPGQPLTAHVSHLLQRRAGKWKLLREHEYSSSVRSSNKGRSDEAAEVLLSSSLHTSQELPSGPHGEYEAAEEGLTLLDTAKLALEFCLLWFLANYFAAACLEHTTVASSTILASTSSIWTLLLGSLMRVERFTLLKLIGVLASLGGVALISMVDVSGGTDENRGSFPHKTPRELAIGDVMAFVSAALYGFYTVFMKSKIGDETKVNMPLFFGLVGLCNIVLLWPGFIILHFTGIETFELPPSSRILNIVLINSASSLVSDFCWAYAMLLTSPLIVTVGLSLTIPCSLVGQMVLDSQYASALYWVGAAIMVLSFLFINHEDRKDEAHGLQSMGADGVVTDVRGSFQGLRQSLSSRRNSRSDV